jgi:hypothetical protein
MGNPAAPLLIPNQSSTHARPKREAVKISARVFVVIIRALLPVQYLPEDLNKVCLDYYC